MKQWLVESKSGMYSKTVIKEHQFEDAWTLGKEIAKAHPELAGEIKGGDVKKYQDNIFKYAGEMLQGAGVSLNMVRGLAMDPDWAMELVTATLDALGRENLKEEYRADKDPEVLYKVKDLVKNMVNRFGKSSIEVGSREWNELISNLEGLFKRLGVEIDSNEFYGNTLLNILQDLQVNINHNNLEETSDNSIKVLRDLYYFDKLGLLAAKEDVDPKYYRYGTLWANKGDVIDNSMEEYDMIANSKRLKKGVDFTQGSLNELNPTALGAPQAAADAKMQQQDDENGDEVDNASMGVAAEGIEDEAAYGNIPSVDKVAPAETGLSKYLDILHAHDWFHHFSDDHRIWQRGQTDKDNLKALYSTLAPNDKQKAMDTFIDKYLQVYKPEDFPGAANNVKYLTTDTFKGAI